MSVFSSLVLNTVCRSNHHRLAIDALDQLQGESAERWRDLFLHHHPAYLEGSKAPDEVFKDFKNHVLHVRDGYWGGAPEAAEEWYRRTVRALGAKDWQYATYCAGVMSHYVVDPIQPFHTGQTEEEGLIHRAVEWSLSKSYMELRRILLVDLGGWPPVKLDDGPNWLVQALRAGADRANHHYETLIEHYDFNVGRKNPPAGLDQEIKDAIAPLIGYAVVLLARVLERAFAESKAVPPRVTLAADTLVAAAKVPVNALGKVVDHANDRRVVTAMYTEFRKTGKVRKSLPEDDKEVRALYAAEVLKVPLSSLDCRWPRETGLAHGAGAPARKTKGRALKPASNVRKMRLTPAEIAQEKRDAKAEARDSARAAKDAAKQAAIQAKFDAKNAVIQAKEDAKAEKAAAAQAVIQARIDSKDDAQRAKAAEQKAREESRAAEQKAKAAQQPRPQPQPQPKAEAKAPEAGLQPISDKRLRLRAEDMVVDAPAIGRKTADRLQAVNVRTVADLLKLDPEEGAKRIKASHINAQLIRDWQAQARLACTVPDVNSTSAQLLVQCGVRDVPGLAASDAPKLHAAMMKYSGTEDGQRLLRSSRPPEVSAVAAWVNAARGAKSRAAA